jgi:hypothetical protein
MRYFWFMLLSSSPYAVGAALPAAFRQNFPAYKALSGFNQKMAQAR